MKKQTKELKIYCILTDESLFHPHYFRGVITSLVKDHHKVVGVTLAKDTYKKGFFYAVLEQIRLWGIIPFLSIAFNSVLRSALYRLKLDTSKTIKGIAEGYSLPVFESLNVNQEEHLSYLRRLAPDIIISSCGHIFKRELLNLPRIACINRHSALLPEYGGVLPVFWAMMNQEQKFGVSVHYMVEKIDQGDILAQREIMMRNENSLFYNYMLAFDLSITVTQEAVRNLLKGKIVKKFMPNKNQYNSFPSKEKISEFKKQHKTFSFTDCFSFYKWY